jgi:predicted nucleic acid-binding protein
VAIAAVLDANILYPIALADFFLTTAGLGLYRVHWSPHILDEVGRNLALNRPDLTTEQIAYRLAAMDRAMPSAKVDPPEELITQMANHPKDRHVLAAAVHAEAGYIVTFNLRDFPAEACDPHDVVVEDPDSFAVRLVNENPALVRLAVEEMASRRSRPPTSPEEVLDHLARRLPLAVQGLREQGHESA